MTINGITKLLVACCLVVNASLVAAMEPSKLMQKKLTVQASSEHPLQSPLEQLTCDKDGATVAGMDLVSYRQTGGPVHGKPEFSIELMGDTYLFSSSANLDTFKNNPQRYLPAYAGFCAMSLALGTVTCPDVMNFKIQDDRLLFFEVTGFTNGQTLWETDPTGFRAKADLYYERFNTH